MRRGDTTRCITTRSIDVLVKQKEEATGVTPFFFVDS